MPNKRDAQQPKRGAAALWSALGGEHAEQQIHGALEVLERGLLDAGEPELAVQPGVDLPVAAAIPACELGTEPVALAAQLRPSLERGTPPAAPSPSPAGSPAGPSGPLCGVRATASALGAGPNSVISGATSALRGSNTQRLTGLSLAAIWPVELDQVPGVFA